MKMSLIDSDNRLSVKFNKVDGIYNWGDDNAHPQLLKSLIDASVTARNCLKINGKYIYGKGFNFDGKNTIVNKYGHTINQILRQSAKELSYSPNLFFHVNYNALYEIISINLLPSTDVRIGKADSTGYSGKFLIYNNWDKSKGKKIEKREFQIIDRFNSNPSVIEAQVKAAGDWHSYKGQILHISNDCGSIYASSDAESIIYDMDSEIKASGYKNNCLREGFYGAKLVVTKPFNDDFERLDFEKTIKGMKGYENTNSILVLEASKESENIKEQFLIEDIDSNIDDKKFAHTEIKSAENIRKAFNVPSILIEDSDNSIFGDSGSLLIQAKKMHWENKEEDRQIISEAFQTIFSKWHEPVNPAGDWSILPIITIENSLNNNEPSDN